MYGIFTHIWLMIKVNAGKYTSPMDGMGYVFDPTCYHSCIFVIFRLRSDAALTRIFGLQLCWQTEVLCRYGRTELGEGGKSLWRMLSCRFAPKFAFWTSSILALDIVIYTYMYDINANLTKVWVSTFNSDFLPDFFHRPPFGDGFNHVLLLLLFLVNDPIWLQ